MSGMILTRIAPDDASGNAQRSDDIQANWPAHAPAPSIRTISLHDALCEPHLIDGDVVIVETPTDAAQRAGALKLIDALDADFRSTVILAAPDDHALSDLAGDRVILLPSDIAPGSLCATLYALAVRQSAVDALAAELKTTRRFQGGLRDEMDRIHEELQLAAHVQQQFFPRSLPQIDGLEFGVLFRPCGYVSGDIYDVARIDETRVGFFVADAVGHGVPAALMTMVLSKAMPSLGADGSLIGPAESLRRLNSALLKRTGKMQTFATAVCGLIDSHRGVITIAGAGHPPPLRIGPDGVQRVETEGGLLGVFEDGWYDETSFSLDPDEILLIHSDGFETAFPDDDAEARRLPSQRYLEFFRRVRDDRSDVGLHSAVERLSSALDAQAGSLHQIDDETALVIALDPSHAHAVAA